MAGKIVFTRAMGLPRFLHVFSTFDHGGAEDRTVRLISEMRSEADHTLWIGVPSASGARKALDPTIAVHIPETEARMVVGRPSLQRYRLIAEALQSFDLILTYSWGAMDVTMAHRLYCQRLRLPPIIHHDDGFDRGSRNHFHDWFRRMALARCYAHVVPSRTLAFTARNNWRVPASKIRIVTNGINLAAYHNAPRSPAIPGVIRDPGAIVVGSIAGLRTVKNLSMLVRAVAGASKDIRLIIAGDGPDRARIEAEIARFGMKSQVNLPGFLPSPATYIRAFDIFALSSESEQAPISMIEAMAAGLPVVATDVGDIRGMVSAENLPFIVKPGDEAGFSRSLAILAADRSLREAIGAANAVKASALFDDRQMFATFRALYMAAVDSRKAR